MTGQGGRPPPLPPVSFATGIGPLCALPVLLPLITELFITDPFIAHNVHNRKVCYEWVCYERGLFQVVCYEEICFERTLMQTSTILRKADDMEGHSTHMLQCHRLEPTGRSYDTSCTSLVGLAKARLD